MDKEQKPAGAVLPVSDAMVERVRHKKRGTEYEVIGVGKMQAEHWVVQAPPRPGNSPADCTADMREVTIYRSVGDGSLWVRPSEEFEDGRFEALTEASQNTGGEQPAPKAEQQLAEIEEMLGGQGDDDGPQILPDFEEGMSTVAKVEACLFRLEKWRDLLEVYDRRSAPNGVSGAVREALADLVNRTENFWALLQGEHGVKLTAEEGDDHNVYGFFLALDRAKAALSQEPSPSAREES